MTRWALFPALVLLLASPAKAVELHAAEQLAACVIGSAVVRLEVWREPYPDAVDQAWDDCSALVGRLPPDDPEADQPVIDEVIHFVDEMLVRLFEEEARAPTASGYNLTPPDTF